MKTAIVIALILFGGLSVAVCLSACVISGRISRQEEQEQEKAKCKNCGYWMQFIPAEDRKYGVCNRFTEYCQTHEDTSCEYYKPKN